MNMEGDQRYNFCPQHGEVFRFKEYKGDKIYVSCCAPGGCDFWVLAKRKEDENIQFFSDVRKDYE